MNGIDLESIGQQLEMRDKLFLSRSSLLRRCVEQFANTVDFVFGVPINIKFMRCFRAKKWINTCLENYAQLLKQLVNIRKARDDFKNMQIDLVQDKANLANQMEEIHTQLVDLRQLYLAEQTDNSHVSTAYSDIFLLVSDYDRNKNLYTLYNDILALIHKTLVETERIEKLANLCGVINSSSFFSEPVMANSSFEDTLYEFLGYVARCDRTKDYITSQLTLAKATNVDDAMKMGMRTDTMHLQNLVEKFVETGHVSHLDATRQKLVVPQETRLDKQEKKETEAQLCPV